MAFENYKRVGHVLYPGQELHANECLISKCGRFYVCLQPDGNFVQYRWKPSGRQVCWSSRTHHNSYGYERCVLRWGTEGQIVLQNDLGETYWKMLDDAHLHDHPQELIIQTDSNFVLYKKGNKAVWSSRAHSHDKEWVIPDCRYVEVKQLSTVVGPLGTLEIESGIHHATVTLPSSETRIISPNSTESFSIPPGTLSIGVRVDHRFDADGKPLDPIIADSLDSNAGKTDTVHLAPGDSCKYALSSSGIKKLSLV